MAQTVSARRGEAGKNCAAVVAYAGWRSGWMPGAFCIINRANARRGRGASAFWRLLALGCFCSRPGAEWRVLFARSRRRKQGRTRGTALSGFAIELGSGILSLGGAGGWVGDKQQIGKIVGVFFFVLKNLFEDYAGSGILVAEEAN